MRLLNNHAPPEDARNLPDPYRNFWRYVFRILWEMLTLRFRKQPFPMTQTEACLCLAALKGETLEVAKALRNGANPNIGAPDNMTPLMAAVQQDNVEIVKLLLEAGADVNVQEKSGGLTALSLACHAGKTANVAALISAGADLNRPTRVGNTPLMQAIGFYHKEAALLLISSGADVNYATQTGNTALMCAARRGHDDIVRELIAHNARTDIRNSEGNTALELAKNGGHIQAARIIESA